MQHSRAFGPLGLTLFGQYLLMVDVILNLGRHYSLGKHNSHASSHECLPVQLLAQAHRKPIDREEGEGKPIEKP